MNEVEVKKTQRKKNNNNKTRQHSNNKEATAITNHIDRKRLLNKVFIIRPKKPFFLRDLLCTFFVSEFYNTILLTKLSDELLINRLLSFHCVFHSLVYCFVYLNLVLSKH